MQRKITIIICIIIYNVLKIKLYKIAENKRIIYIFFKFFKISKYLLIERKISSVVQSLDSTYCKIIILNKSY